MLHSGSLSGGHYTAYALHQEETGEEQWYLFNDSSKSKVDAQSVLNNESAYMLFYKRIQ